MHYIIVSDIYGKTPALQDFCKALNTKFTLVEPYGGKEQAIESEENNYKNFIKECGHNAYTTMLHKKFDRLISPTVCIAFSAGASAAWRAQLLTGNPHLKKVVGFYPSQIRNYLNLKANVPCEFIFPYHETHFDVTAVINELNEKQNVICQPTGYCHGFMNKRSLNYNEQAYQHFYNYLKSNEFS
ncbi:MULTISPECIES: hypothetical protein [unclassified Pseudoalteromonas]|uniref:hypothetical protein n=1 Tax=unclassified Pseudoalteromonas TaxID=194690 RepID=UPI001107B61D|nr:MULTISPECIES: hypothetical protein [unclassified Pseudoalteromonas]TMN82705.1 hypothetical protein CWB64_08380 [Pseudoalteromonas sp. S410]TMN92718.1 hypothetical protein CWB62_03140 [Pseudoalteromonas sp. S408]TMN97490.1 hypothetical protein CWB63_13340 [Pseudoalteromonas sp. S409]TMO01043.1 hypothetical protein CWB61_01785 [Pseudoalteromonas sp. S407]TMO11241.1 hypothetical protein CWB57_08095 [Pseudoalteromonas sp. S186]|tara:strand:- start:644 stop:1198 length:555 start_codon:yes stop_codon:yes gene_type:complete